MKLSQWKVAGMVGLASLMVFAGAPSVLVSAHRTEVSDSASEAQHS